MNRRKEDIEKIVDAHLGLFDSPSAEDVAGSRERTLERLRARAAEGSPNGANIRFSRFSRVDWKRWLSPLAAAAVVAFVVFILQWQPSRGAVYALVDGERIEAGEVVRTNADTGALLTLPDGSSIEIRSNSELSLEPAEDGVIIPLSKGGIIVDAAKQREGHLYVQTKDVRVSVVGTVFFVNAEEKGSRVAVIEGEVRVQQGTEQRTLLQGEQFTSNPRMPELSVKEEIAWSRHAETHLASLQQATPPRATPQPAPEAPPKPQVLPTGKQTFEEAAVRLRQGPTGEATGRGAGPGMALRGCQRPMPPTPFQVDPSRFYGSMNLYSWILFAYSDYDCLRVYEFVEDILPFEPSWLRSVIVQIEANFPQGSLAGKEYTEGKPAKLKEMVQVLLEEKFKLVLRRTQKEMQVFTMKIAEAGPKLTSAREGDPLHCGQNRVCSLAGGGPPDFPRSDVRPSWFQGSNATSAHIAEFLTAKLFRPVLDRTGLTGTFTFKINYVPREGDPGNDGYNFQKFRDAGVIGPNLREALEKELGLKVESTRAPVQVLAIDRVERPAEK
jgi:uncharacterized protein (TIGR03435 family)